ncbi:hypothetical protein ASC89_21475 [Devosia sp. Root413D1]|uniref:hypothetical protein n=1 Tax=unclassified Devosia TaxID=196773 RepID=UPI0006F966EC|nr:MULTISPECIES: hypothetical protein [unclassified Devosia]KQU95184.1 hypothetical protein ASC68_18700 [Devosia sp. Root105]KQW77730.1 hypothetical protein ASC89_21475 [Devosia sp. Root413D1]
MAPDYPTDTDLSPDRTRSDAAALTETAQSDLSHLGEEVKQQAAAIGDEAMTQLEGATEKAKGMAADQKDLLVAQLGGVSGALQKVAGELDSSGEAGSRYVRMLADGAEKLTSTVRDNDVDQIIGIAQDFGRKQPVAFMGAAALLGFVASRFVLASASRKPDAAASPSGSAYSSTYGSGNSSNYASGRSGPGQGSMQSGSNPSTSVFNEGGRNGGY